MADDLDILAADIQSYIVAPMAAFGLGGFVFDVEGESTSSLQSDITDNYSEDNLASNDHIARKPKKLTLKGYVGELFYDANTGIFATLQNVEQKLTVIAAFIPQVSASISQLQAANTPPSTISDLSLSDAADIYGIVKNLLGSITGDTPRQQQAYAYFQACWQQGILMGVQTPWTFLTNMAIEDVTAIQGENTKYISDFSVRYKQLRFIQTKTTAYQNSNYAASSPDQQVATDVQAEDPGLQGAAAVQAQDPTSIGNVQGAALPDASLPGAQANISAVDDLSPQANQPALQAFRAANGLPTPPIDKYYNGLSSIYVKS
jgi:hypothetical protein